MRHLYRQRKRLMAEMNVVPYIDVMLVLLIIFMVTSPMLKLTQGVEVDLPQVTAQGSAKNPLMPLVITVDADGNLFLSSEEEIDTPLSLNALATRVAALYRLNPARAVLVRGDQAVSHGRVVQLMGVVQDSGVDKVGVVTRAPD